jgi:hypothetical protein
MDALHRKSLKRNYKRTRPRLVRKMSLLLRTDAEIEYGQYLKRIKGTEN